jgi:hypothetical protein
MLYQDGHPIQSSRVMHVSPHEQRVFVQLFCLTSQRNHTKMKLFICADCRNNVLLRLKFAFMTFKSQNDCMCGTSTSPTSHPTDISRFVVEITGEGILKL